MSEQGTGDVLLKLTVLGNPASKKNNCRIYHTPQQRPFILPSARFEAFQREAAQYISDDVRLHINQPCNIECHYFRADHRRVDLVNLLQATDDILVHYGVIADDNSKIVAGHDGSRVLHDKDNPRTEIVITSMEAPQENT